MPDSKTHESDLASRIQTIADSVKVQAVAVAMYDYESEIGFSYHGDQPFHAASTIKVPVLVAVFAAIDGGAFSLDSRVHVRNRFYSVADGSAYRLSTGRDANSAVHRALGKTMKVEELAYHMITTSSNLATNLLIELVGLDQAQKSIKELGIDGVELRRGVEDEIAFEKDINNKVTANGLLKLFRLIEDKKAVSPEASEKMLEILHKQEFRSGIPAGLPSDVRSNGARVAHKTGEISTVAHDTGLVFLPNRKPYVLTILTGWEPDQGHRHEAVAKLSRAVYDSLTSNHS